MSLSSTLPFFRGHLRARPLRMLRTELKRPLAEVMVRPANRRGSTRGEADLYEPERNVPLLADRDAPTVGAIDSLTEAQATTTCFVGIRRRSAAPQIGKPSADHYAPTAQVKKEPPRTGVRQFPMSRDIAGVETMGVEPTTSSLRMKRWALTTTQEACIYAILRHRETPGVPAVRCQLWCQVCALDKSGGCSDGDEDDR